MSSKFTKKLDILAIVKTIELCLSFVCRTMRKSMNVAKHIRKEIEKHKGSYWTNSDFSALSTDAVSQTFSRMEREGALERVGKGLYYRPRKTRFGYSYPSQAEIQKFAEERKLVGNLHPAGVSAANLLGFTTQNAIHGEFATSANSVPRTIIGSRARLHTRRPSTWNDLSNIEASLLDFLRNKGELSELSPAETRRRLLDYFREGNTYERLVNVAGQEPPRVRAMLGAIGQELSKDSKSLENLRKNLKPLSRFDFGKLSNLKYAKEWQAK